MKPTPHQLESLVALAAGEISGSEAEELRAAMDRDPDWQVAFDELSRVVRFLRAEPATSPSPEAVGRAGRLLSAQRPGLVQQLDRGLRRILAALDFDSRLSPAVAGIRGAGTTVMLSFSSEAADLDLELTPARGSEWLIRGQIESDREGAWQVVPKPRDGTLQSDRALRTEGAFEMSVAEGVYTLLLLNGDVRVEAGPFTVP